MNKLKKTFNEVDIDKLVYEIAEYKREKDYELFLKEILNRELYFSIVQAEKVRNTSVNSKMTERNLSVPSTTMFNELKMIVMHTSKDDERLSNPYAGINGLKGLEMVLKMPKVDGLVIQNKESSWVGLRKEKIENLLSAQSA
jgi:hypothetical protein